MNSNYVIRYIEHMVVILFVTIIIMVVSAIILNFDKISLSEIILNFDKISLSDDPKYTISQPKGNYSSSFDANSYEIIDNCVKFEYKGKVGTVCGNFSIIENE